MKQVVVFGASGYTGAELVRLLHSHPHVNITSLVADSQAGQEAGAVYPHLRGLDLPPLIRPEEVNWSGIDAVFLCLPHGASQSVMENIPPEVVIIDLSADFRLKDADSYTEWYGAVHACPERLEEAVYGLPEVNRAAIEQASLIACPGCYPTAVGLPLIPLLHGGMVTPDQLIIDAKSGVTGAGRSVKQANLFAEVNEGISAYGIGQHRHIPEIEQELSLAAGRRVMVSFTPHLVPMNRGILATMYAHLDTGVTVEEIREGLRIYYAGAPFIAVMDDGPTPSTHQVRGSNRCMIGVYADRQAGRVILVSVIDNLIKGASGQAIQNFNIRFGLNEESGLGRIAQFP